MEKEFMDKERQLFLDFLRIAVSFLIAFYLGVKLSTFITLGYSNPYGIVSPLSAIKYNPINNYIKYLVVIISTPIFFIFIDSFLGKKSKK